MKNTVSVPDQRPAQPTSLTRKGARDGRTCAACGSERLTALAMTLTDGTPVSFLSCHACEHRTWAHEGSALELTDVLARAQKIKA